MQLQQLNFFCLLAASRKSFLKQMQLRVTTLELYEPQHEFHSAGRFSKSRNMESQELSEVTKLLCMKITFGCTKSFIQAEST